MEAYIDLIQHLKEIFPEKKPSDMDLYHTRPDYTDYEGNFLKRELQNKKWSDFLDIEGRKKLFRIFGEKKLFPFLTSKGYAYFLPAFLIYMLIEEDYEFLQFCIFCIYPDESEESLNRVGEFHNLLDESQIDELKKFLLLISDQWTKWGVDNNFAKLALLEYWDFV